MPALPIRDEVPPAELRRLAKPERDVPVARRLLATAATLHGMSREATARPAGMDRQTLRDWVFRYNRGGPAGLSDHWGVGGPCRLTEGRQATLQADRRRLRADPRLGRSDEPPARGGRLGA